MDKQKTIHKLTNDEIVLEDNYPVIYGYAYIGDMKFIRNNVLMRGTVGELKREMNLTEIRRCDIFAHEGAKIGDKLKKGEQNKKIIKKYFDNIPVKTV